MSANDQAAWVARLPGWARERYEERAAVMEFEGGLERSEAEMRARAVVDVEVQQALRSSRLGHE